MSTANLTRSETAHRSDLVSDVRYDVALDLTDARTAAEFPTVTTLTFASRESTTWLDFLGAGVDRVVVNGAEIPVDYDGARIAVRDLLSHNVVEVHARGNYSRSGEGLHRFVDPADGETYLYTQYEPADARRVFANFEQPDLKGPFTFRVTAPPEWTVLSNERIESEDGATRVFAATKPISTYITAVVAGPYHRARSRYERGDLVIDLGAYCRASLAGHLDHDTIFEVTRAGLDFFHEKFDYPYPFGKYDQVFVPEYNLGAMENPGCVTFTESYVFRSAATRAQYERRANTILHEMAHMWFGDLVTMTWWDDLWLKESLADYLGAYASVAATEFTGAWVSFANRRKAWAYSQDQLPTTHPVVADIVDLEAAKLNFDGITYAKGASVVKQLAAFVGDDAFFAGARAYFRAHAFGTATLTSLLDALSGAAGMPLDDWSAAWLETTGVSTISYDRATGVLSQTDPRPQRLDIACLQPDADGHLVDADPVSVHITDAHTTLDLPDAAVILPNDGDRTYAKVRLDPASLETVTASLDRVPDDLRRGLIWSSLWNATRDAELPAATFVSLATRFAPTERNAGILGAVLADTAVAVERYCADREQVRPTWTATTLDRLSAAAAGSDAQLEWFRAFAAAAAHDDASAPDVRALLSGDTTIDGLALDAEQRWSLWFALAATGHADVSELDEVLASDRTGAGEVQYAAAVAAQPSAEVKADVWATLTGQKSTGAGPSNEKVGAMVRGFTAGTSRHAIERFDDEYFDLLETFWRENSIEIARRLVIGLFPQTESTNAADAWLAGHESAPAALRRCVVEQRDHLARALRARAAG
ncbi:aminopeptidase N [Rhodococcus sp. MEB064]|uniref:aminopeptidase N n=1 Tax=Rhodococcus sp. MEB064 TaxID=1587522 RepID=UPI0005AC2674|nr:aminopeptidase N [Rhodococcus sp. MEB064]KIQ18369.1 aminopeptidase N [Rhodococcus sp. MEB064]